VRAFRSTGWSGIVVPVFLLTVLLMLMTGAALNAIGLPGWAIALLLVLFAVPASEGALGMFNTVVLLFLKPTRLIGYEFREGVPAEARTLVVVPTLIGSRDDVEDTIRKLEVHHLANMMGEVHFEILSDWPDRNIEQDTADDEILAFAQASDAEAAISMMVARLSRAVEYVVLPEGLPVGRCNLGLPG
jgi:cyclic beta-1,2-glucan synthetase